MKKNNDWHECVQQAIANGEGTGDIIRNLIDDYGISYNAAQKRVASLRHTSCGSTSAPVSEEEFDEGVNPRSFELKGDGEKVFGDIIAVMNKGNVNEDDIIKAHGLSKDWTVVSLKCNPYQVQKKGGSKMVLYQSKLTVRPTRPTEYTLEDIDEYFKNKKYRDIPIPNVKYSKDGCTLEIVVPDIHIGLLSWRHETGEDYDLSIAKKLYFNAITNVIAKVKAYNIRIKNILLVTCGDLLHVDNDEQTTTKGTFQQVDGRLPKIIDYAIDMMCETIQVFEKIAPVEYIYIAGNHDRVLGYTVAKALSKAYETHKNVKFNISPNPHKYKKIGKVIVGWTHGDMNKKNLGSMIYNIARGDLGNVKRCFIHCGHKHTAESFTAENGTYVSYLDSLCPASYWEHQQGYSSTEERYINAFIWDGKSALPPDNILGSTLA